MVSHLGSARSMFVRFLTVIVAMNAALTLMTAPALAADHGINMTQACRYTHGHYDVESAWISFGNPFSWVCRQKTISYGIPGGISFTTIGGVDVQKYCSTTHRGSRAVLVAHNIAGWQCRS